MDLNTLRRYWVLLVMLGIASNATAQVNNSFSFSIIGGNGFGTNTKVSTALIFFLVGVKF